VAGLGLAGAAFIGCDGGDDGDDADDNGNGSGSSGGNGGATATTAPSTPAPSEVKQGGTLRMHGEDPIGFDPHGNFSYRTHLNQSFFQDTLFEFPIGPGFAAGDFTPVPNLAEDYEQVDETTFTVKLKPGVKWQNKPPVDGRELVAEDVVYSYERMVEKKFTYRDLIEGVVETMEAVDDQTIRFELTQPYADFINNLANHYNWIVAPELDDEFGDNRGSAEAAVGLGPFILDQYEEGVRTIWVPNPDYHLGPPNVDTVEFLVLAEAATREAMLRAGDLDIVNVATLSRESIEGTNPDISWWEYYGNGGPIFYYDAAPGAFADDLRVRQGFCLAVDRQAWLDSFYQGKGTINNGPPVLAAYTDWQLSLEDLGDGQRWWEYDPDEGRKMLDAAGFDFDRTYKMDSTGAYGSTYLDYMQLAMELIGELGVKFETNLKEYGDWLATGHAGIYDDFAFGPMTPQISLDAWVFGLFHSSSGVNKSHRIDPTLDGLVEKTRSLYDVDERKGAVADASRYIADQAIYIYPPVGITNHAVQPWVKNHAPKLGYFAGKTVRSAWIDHDA
jgi:peptide/nickel transport system substrate-binding protein